MGRSVWVRFSTTMTSGRESATKCGAWTGRRRKSGPRVSSDKRNKCVDHVDSSFYLSPGSLAVWVSRRNTATRCLESILLSRKEALNGLISKQVNDLLVGIESQERVDKLGMREIGAGI